MQSRLQLGQIALLALEAQPQLADALGDGREAAHEQALLVHRLVADQLVADRRVVLRHAHDVVHLLRAVLQQLAHVVVRAAQVVQQVLRLGRHVARRQLRVDGLLGALQERLVVLHALHRLLHLRPAARRLVQHAQVLLDQLDVLHDVHRDRHGRERAAVGLLLLLLLPRLRHQRAQLLRHVLRALLHLRHLVLQLLDAVAARLLDLVPDVLRQTQLRLRRVDRVLHVQLRPLVRRLLVERLQALQPLRDLVVRVLVVALQRLHHLHITHPPRTHQLRNHAREGLLLDVGDLRVRQRVQDLRLHLREVLHLRVHLQLRVRHADLTHVDAICTHAVHVHRVGLLGVVLQGLHEGRHDGLRVRRQDVLQQAL